MRLSNVLFRGSFFLSRSMVMKISEMVCSFLLAGGVGSHVCFANTSMTQEFPTYSASSETASHRVTVEVECTAEGLRRYDFSTTQPQRDDAAPHRIVREHAGDPRLRSGNGLFDGLFALALDDLALLRVEAIRDGLHNEGEPIPLEAFQTGAKWPYVWTRDASYATDLALASFEPERAASSILFKTSGFREGATVPAELAAFPQQIVQDTGSGGSWPVSTDRVTWSFAAEAILDGLTGEPRAEFARRAYPILRGTIEADRLAAFDSTIGLYGGEQSFLDWRTQTYAPWITENLSWMAASKALSTNLAHYATLRLAARLAREFDEDTVAARYESWADSLKSAINKVFWLPEVGLYASLTTPDPIIRPVYKFDLLGESLAILTGVADEAQATQILSNYPHGPMGAPVYFPQQPDVYVYHNRALWPFVTAYALRAAHQARHPAAADYAIRSLVRGAALNLSNMENFEWLTGLPFFDDGPAINSQRQLWSVAGYLNMVVESVMGLRWDAESLQLDPFLPRELRAMFGDEATVLRLENFTVRGFTLEIDLQLPEATDLEDVEGYYPLEEVWLNGNKASANIPFQQLSAEQTNRLELRLGTFQRADPHHSSLHTVPSVDPLARRDPVVYAPEVPEVSATVDDGTVTLSIKDSANAPDATEYLVFRDGVFVERIRDAGSWQDPVVFTGEHSRFYSVEAVYPNGHRSHPSRPLRLDGASAQFIPVTDARCRSNRPATKEDPRYTAPVILQWGAPDDLFEISGLHLPKAGVYAIYLLYNNHAHSIDSGVTCAVKRISLQEGDRSTAATGVIAMPNVEGRDDVFPLRESTPWLIEVEAGTFTLRLEDFFNMSSLQTNASYGATGGSDGPHNRLQIAGVVVYPLP